MSYTLQQYGLSSNFFVGAVRKVQPRPLHRVDDGAHRIPSAVSHARWADFGYLTLIAGLVHSILHAARYIYANMAYIMYETDAGRSGLIACLLLLFVVPPMKFEFFKTKVRKASFEKQKKSRAWPGARARRNRRIVRFLVTYFVSPKHETPPHNAIPRPGPASCVVKLASQYQ